eukprot:365126-Chlamydomonas_euryale.AAC.1
MSANHSNQVTRRLTSPGFDRALAGRSGPVFSRPAALRPATRQASGVGNLGTKQRSLENTQRNRNACLVSGRITAKISAKISRVDLGHLRSSAAARLSRGIY